MAVAQDRTPAKTAAQQDGPPTGADRFYNRELSWLQFNRRVLEEAQNERHPLLERLRFLSISASNLDEFYMVRVAGVVGQVAANCRHVNAGRLVTKKQLTEINRFAAKLVADKQGCWRSLKKDLVKWRHPSCRSP